MSTCISTESFHISKKNSERVCRTKLAIDFGLKARFDITKTLLTFISEVSLLLPGTDFCVLRENDTQCKMLIQLTWWFWLMPDWLAVPVSLDRLNAILSPVWLVSISRSNYVKRREN